MILRSKSPDRVRHQYTGDIVWLDGTTECVTHWSGLHSGSIDALRAIHTFAQREKETDSNRKTVRPLPKPDGYRVKNLQLVCHDSTGKKTEKVLYENVDAPSPINSDLRPVRHPQPKFNEFPFVDHLGQSQSSTQGDSREPNTHRQ